MKKLRDPRFYSLKNSYLYSRANFPIPSVARHKPWLEYKALGNTKPLAAQDARGGSNPTTFRLTP